ncbi:ankyrin-like membrane protein, partial [Xanthomonas translucens DAR61454]
MTESPFRARAPWIAAALGVLLALLAGFGPLAAALGAWLAQPAFALALSWSRGRRPRP